MEVKEILEKLLSNQNLVDLIGKIHAKDGTKFDVEAIVQKAYDRYAASHPDILQSELYIVLADAVTTEAKQFMRDHPAKGAVGRFLHSILNVLFDVLGKGKE